MASGGVARTRLTLPQITIINSGQNVAKQQPEDTGEGPKADRDWRGIQALKEGNHDTG